jgi:hypothetical protein
VPDLSIKLLFFVEFWPTRESFGMARGLRFWALGVDSGPRGGAFEGILDPPKLYKIYFLLVPKGRLRQVPRQNRLRIGPRSPGAESWGAPAPRPPQVGGLPPEKLGGRQPPNPVSKTVMCRYGHVPLWDRPASASNLRVDVGLRTFETD